MENRELESEMNRVAAMASARIYEAMRVAGLKQADLAAKVGVAESRVSRVLEGDANLTLKTMVQFGLGCGVLWDIQPVNLGMSVQIDSPRRIFSKGAPASTHLVEAGASPLGI